MALPQLSSTCCGSRNGGIPLSSDCFWGQEEAEVRLISIDWLVLTRASRHQAVTRQVTGMPHLVTDSLISHARAGCIFTTRRCADNVASRYNNYMRPIRKPIHGWNDIISSTKLNKALRGIGCCTTWHRSPQLGPLRQGWRPCWWWAPHAAWLWRQLWGWGQQCRSGGPPPGLTPAPQCWSAGCWSDICNTSHQGQSWNKYLL